ncbi:hypothetical protein BDQ17DRAFT_1457741 [Cyathus striatus]|nr:hypothetical protein BDQ17DRAFT_1457741 [Cyathus striatus]
MFSLKYIISAIAVASSASAAAVNARAEDNVLATQATTVTFCSGSLNPPNGCAAIPIASNVCINFTGGLTFLDKTVSNGLVPSGVICTVFEQLNCESSTVSDRVLLTAGTWDFFSVTGDSGPVNFNDLASSFVCTSF